MRRYEGLYILNTAGQDEGIDELIESITSDITSRGGTIEKVEKMGKRSFARVADRRDQSGYYVDILFEAEPSVLDQLKDKYALDETVFRILFTRAPVEEEREPQTAQTE